ncbi:MAG: hypothetical protein P8H31_01930 [Porticoccaceae bacterium]|nr:hypothetical protein [Porticoccaceae bacterium]
MRTKRAESYSPSFSTELHSNLAPLLFERVQVDKQLVVLDIGLAMPSTVDLFSNFKCKLIFVDLYSAEVLSQDCPQDSVQDCPQDSVQDCPQDSVQDSVQDCFQDSSEKNAHQQLVDQFTAALNLDAKTKIDICLFWDFFNYLDGTLFKAFIEALHPYISDNACGYGLGVLNARCQLPNVQYGISKLDNLNQYSRSDAQKPVYPHSQRDLNNLLGYFDVDKSRLMPDGRVEYFIAQGSDSKFAKKAIFQ